MKKFGDVVVMALGDKIANALVVQSVQQIDGEHLVVFYLDPSHEATAMGGQSVDAAIKKSFVVPLSEGKTFGWKDLPDPVLPTGGEPATEAGEQSGQTVEEPTYIVDFNDLLALSMAVADVAPESEINPDATIRSATAALKSYRRSNLTAVSTITAQAAKITAQQATIKEQAEELASLHAKLAESEAEAGLDAGEVRPASTEGLPQASDVNLATNIYVDAKEAAPKATADPTPSTDSAQSDPSPEPIQDSSTTTSEPGTTSDNPLPG